MTRYLFNFVCTIILGLATISLYIVKNFNVLPEWLRLLAYLLVFSLNFLLLLSTVYSSKILKPLYNHKFYGENAKNKVKYLINLIKDMTNVTTNVKTKIIHTSLAFILAVLLEFIYFGAKVLGITIFVLFDYLLDFIAVLSIINTLLQSHINYSIFKYLSEDKKGK